ncbi:MAG: hypothetical protein GEV09_05860 [Pseudonocardiaceae bacterium]|nr:hypothetical protein [Pseudonocardiaceae bacterium]
MDTIGLATSAIENPTVTLVLLGLVWLAGYSLTCWWWPYASCSWCEAGKHRSPSGKAWRTCRHCKGKGRRIRLGRRLWRGAGLDKLRN